MPWHHWLALLLLVSNAILLVAVLGMYVIKLLPREPGEPSTMRPRSVHADAAAEVSRRERDLSRRWVVVVIGTVLVVLVIVACVIVLLNDQAMNWLEANKDALSGLGSLAASVGLIASAVVLAVGVWQLKMTRDTNRATATYNAMKDVRDEMTRLAPDLFGSQPDGDDEDGSKAQLRAVRHVINIYGSLFVMWEAGVLTNADWSRIKYDIENFSQRQEISDFWGVWRGVHKGYPERFQKEMAEINKRAVR